MILYGVGFGCVGGFVGFALWGCFGCILGRINEAFKTLTPTHNKYYAQITRYKPCMGFCGCCVGFALCMVH